VIDIAALVRKIETAAAGTAPFLLSTVNVNFLVTAQFDEEFRQSLLLSDLCTADGMPIVWMCRLSGIPIKLRIAGGNIFEALKSTLGSGVTI
jgi:N-acetylglucosaminyldiphosphoundecaprenol N-acetyl-beta-D-mannosaminyltransferase